jgi:CRISPR-associated protein Cas2
LIILVLTASPPKLRGHLTRWLFEISPGVYVGKVSARVRELLWQQVLENIGKGRAVMVHPANNEQGLDFRVRGQEWEPVDYEGLKLIMRPNSNKQQLNRQDNLERNERSKSKADIQRKKTGWSKVSRYRRYAR